MPDWKRVLIHFLRGNELSLQRGEMESLKTLLNLVVGIIKYVDSTSCQLSILLKGLETSPCPGANSRV
jgi:hypothetical protein